MARTKLRFRSPGSLALRSIAAALLVVTAGCGSSDNGSGKDATFDLSGNRDGDRVSLDTRGSAEVLTPVTDVQPTDLNTLDTGPGRDVSIDVQRPDVPIDTPIPGTEVGGDEGPSVDVTSIEAGSGTGGAGGNGGTTGEPGAGGTTFIGGGGAGGSTGAGGTVGDASGEDPTITGWPTTTPESPYIFATTSCIGAAQQSPVSYTFTLTNAAPGVATFTDVSFSGATGYTTDLAAGTSTILPGQSTVVTITAPAIPYPVAAPATYSGVLTVTTNEAVNNVHIIHLAEIVHGAMVAWGPDVGPAYIGGGSPGDKLSQDFVIANTGDEPATVNITTSDPNFTISAPAAAVTIPAGGKVTRTLSIVAPTTQGTYTTDIGLSPSGTNNLCSPLPGKWSATAISLSGYPKFVPGGGTFAFSGSCGTNQTEKKAITITNVGTADLRWRPVISDTNSCFAISSPASTGSQNDPQTWLNLSMGATDTIEISRVAIPAGATTKCENTLNVWFANANGISPLPQTYKLSLVPVGANLTVTPGALNFGTALLSAPTQTVLTQLITIRNDGFSDPLVAAPNNTATVTLSLSNNAFSFDRDTSVMSLPKSVGADGGTATATVYYRRPQVGPMGNSTKVDDTSTVTWSLGQSDKSCMCPAADHVARAFSALATAQNYHIACPLSQGTAASLTGSTTEGDLLSRDFSDPQHPDFGTVFCGARADSRSYVVTNNGWGDATITSADLDSQTYFSVTPSYTLPKTIAKGNSITFTITPKVIAGADISSPADLGSSSDKFSTNLTIRTNVPGSTVIGVPLHMYAQGVIIDPVSPTAWTYQDIAWPASRSSNFTAWITNRGNLKGTATLTPATGAIQFSMADTIVNEIGAQTPLFSTFGGTVFNPCTTNSAAYSAPATLSVVAQGISGATRQTLGSSQGICQGGVTGAWTQSLTLAGQLNRAASMCGTGQRCVAAAEQTGYAVGTCVCDSALESCGLIGCCTTVGVNGTCVPYASQTTKLSNVTPGLTGCGQAGGQCAQCADPDTASCTAGQCSCPSNGEYCNGVCKNLNTDPGNCGGCYQINSSTTDPTRVCSTAQVVTPSCQAGECNGACAANWANCDEPQTKRAIGCNINLLTNHDNCGQCGHKCSASQACVGGTCTCDPQQCTNGCCNGQGACIPYSGQSFSVCGSSGGACTSCVNNQECASTAQGGVCECDPNTCPTGCCNSAGVCYAGTSDELCGGAGGTCLNCTANQQTCVSKACHSP